MTNTITKEELNVKALKNFIEAEIEDMGSNLKFAIGDMAKNHDHDAEWWRDWCLKSIRRSEERAFGSMLYMNCFAHELDDYTFGMLSDVVRDARSEEESKVWQWYYEVLENE